MSEVLQANIFFYIASAATIVFSLFGVIILWQLLKVITVIRSILERVETASEVVAEDVAHVRQLVATQGLVRSVVGFVLGKAKTQTKRRKSSSVEE